MPKHMGITTEFPSMSKLLHSLWNKVQLRCELWVHRFTDVHYILYILTHTHIYVYIYMYACMHVCMTVKTIKYFVSLVCTCFINGKIFKYGATVYNTTDWLGHCITAVCGPNGTIIRNIFPCLTTTTAVPTTTPFRFSTAIKTTPGKKKEVLGAAWYSIKSEKFNISILHETDIVKKNNGEEIHLNLLLVT